MRKRSQIEYDLTFVLDYINDAYTTNPTYQGVLVGEALDRLKHDIVDSRDDCDVCEGSRGGIRGNENLVRVNDKFVSMCDQCHLDHLS